MHFFLQINHLTFLSFKFSCEKSDFFVDPNFGFLIYIKNKNQERNNNRESKIS